MRAFFAGAPPRRFGHRGSAGTHPENTLAGFQAAAETGVDGLELDVHRTADGEIVVLHDTTLDRTTDGTGPLRDRTLDELRDLDAGYRFSPDGGRTFPFRGSGIRIPTLAEVCAALPAMPLIVEIKQVDPAPEADLARALAAAEAIDRTLVFSLDQRPLDRYRQLVRTQATGFGPDDVAEFLRRVNRDDWGDYAVPGVALAVPVRWHGTQIVSRSSVDAAHRIGCEVFVWTVNEPDEMERLLDLGVDGLISDHPARLARVIAERAIRLASRSAAVDTSASGG